MYICPISAFKPIKTNKVQAKKLASPEIYDCVFNAPG